MELTGYFNSNVYSFIILPLFIFIARVCDVSIGTIRIIFISKGYKLFAFFIGFMEIFIWILAIGQIFNNQASFMLYLAYAGGFATGTYVGMVLEEKIAIGIQLIRIITGKKAKDLVEFLRKEGYRVTSVEAWHNTGAVNIVYVAINRRDIHDIVETINEFNPNAFYTVEDIRSVNKELFSKNKSIYKKRINLLKLRKKSK